MTATGGTDVSPAPRLVDAERRPPRRTVRRLPPARCDPSGTEPRRELVVVRVETAPTAVAEPGGANVLGGGGEPGTVAAMPQTSQ